MPRGLSLLDEYAVQGRLLTPLLCAKRLSSVLSAWYNADPENLTRDADGLSSGARDLSGHGNDATVGISAYRPTFFPSDAMFGGRSAFGSLSSSGYIGFQTPSFRAQCVLMSCYYKDGLDTTFDVYTHFLAGPGIAGAVRVMGNVSTAALIGTSAFATVTYKNGSGSSGDILPLPASVCRWDGDCTQTWRIMSGSAAATTGRVLVGGIRNVVFFQLVPSPWELAMAEGVIAWDGGHAGRLVGTHPYKNRPPEISE